MSSTQEALDHHLDSFGQGDLDGILAHYASPAVMFTPRPPERAQLRSGRSSRHSLRSSANRTSFSMPRVRRDRGAGCIQVKEVMP